VEEEYDEFGDDYPIEGEESFSNPVVVRFIYFLDRLS
jgi:hypothetical protein